MTFVPDQPPDAVQVTGVVVLLLILHDSVVLSPSVMLVEEALKLSTGAMGLAEGLGEGEGVGDGAGVGEDDGEGLGDGLVLPDGSGVKVGETTVVVPPPVWSVDCPDVGAPDCRLVIVWSTWACRLF